MAYEKDTPQNISEILPVSQEKIRNNFNEIETLISQDHETFGNASQGKHKRVIFSQQAADVSTAATEMALYTKDNGGSPNIYLRKESNSTIYNITPNDTNHGSNGSETLPSGLTLMWGSAVATGTGVVITFPNGGFSTECYKVNVSRNGVAGSVTEVYVVYGSITKTQFTAEARKPDGSDSTANITYFAIGK